MEVTDTSLAIKGIEEKYNGQDTQPTTTYPNGQYLRGSKSVESIGAGLAKLLLSLYQKRPERPVALCKQTT